MDLLNVPAATTSDSNTKVLMLDGSTLKSRTVSGLSLGSIPDGDKGDITTSSSGATWTIDNAAVSNAKLANMTASTIKANVSGSSAAPSDATLTQVLDLVGSAAQGDILYRGASSWTRLGAGTSGQYLKTQGTGANPVWATVTASASRLQSFTLFQSAVSGGSGNPYIISQAASTDGFGFPNSKPADSGGQTTNRDASLLITSKFILDFNPTNFRISAVCAANPTYYSGTPTSGDFGFKLQWSTDGSSWNNFTSTLGFRTKVEGDFVTTTGSVSVSTFSSYVYFRCITVQTLSPSTAVDVSVRNVEVTFWN